LAPSTSSESPTGGRWIPIRTVVINPDGAGPFFEVPIVAALPEGLNF
jgi:hypothetical protein